MDSKEASIVSAAITSALGLASLSLPDETASVFSVMLPSVQSAIDMGLSTIGLDRLSHREQYRVGSVVWWALKIAKENEQAGRTVLQTEFNQGDVNSLVEALFRAAAEDSQELKDRAYGCLLGNFAYQDKFDSGALFPMAKMLKEMSVDELLLLAALKGRPAMNYELIYERLEHDGSLREGEMFGYFARFRSRGLTARVKPVSSSSYIGNIMISALGDVFCDLADLQEIDSVQCDEMRGYLDVYARPVGVYPVNVNQ